jgi:hypothetical protein
MEPALGPGLMHVRRRHGGHVPAPEGGARGAGNVGVVVHGAFAFPSTMFDLSRQARRIRPGAQNDEAALARLRTATSSGWNDGGSRRDRRAGFRTPSAGRAGLAEGEVSSQVG